jgi:hypothetical protein
MSRKKSDQTIRWARISRGVVGSRRGKYSGKTPHSK